MPDLDLALIADHVGVDGGVAYVMRGCIDTVAVPEVPAARNVGLLLRVRFSRSECGRPHRIEVLFQGEDGERLMDLESVVTPQWDAGLPAHWKAQVLAGLNFGIPLPRYGNYAFHVLINDSEMKAIDLRVIPPPRSSAPSEAGSDA